MSKSEFSIRAAIDKVMEEKASTLKMFRRNAKADPSGPDVLVLKLPSAIGKTEHTLQYTGGDFSKKALRKALANSIGKAVFLPIAKNRLGALRIKQHLRKPFGLTVQCENGRSYRVECETKRATRYLAGIVRYVPMPGSWKDVTDENK